MTTIKNKNKQKQKNTKTQKNDKNIGYRFSACIFFYFTTTIGQK